MIEIFRAWDVPAQWLFFAGSIGAALLAIWIVCDNARIVLRGYPPVGEEKEECNHDDNLTGYCIKRGVPCKTRDECDKAVEEKEE